MWSKTIHKLTSWISGASDDSSEKSLGQLGEDAAARFLRGKKIQVVDRNVRFQNGEIDIVAVENRTVVFVEVKTRRSNDKGEPWEAVDRIKQAKILDLADAYMTREDILDQKARFDIVSVTWSDDSKAPIIEHLVDAFDESTVSDQFSI